MGLVFGFCQAFTVECWGQGPPRIKIESTASQKINLTVGKSTLLQSPTQVKRVSLVAPETADAMVITPHQIQLTGRARGSNSPYGERTTR
jgi:Flp pilus assembly secretin CpaC